MIATILIWREIEQNGSFLWFCKVTKGIGLYPVAEYCRTILNYGTTIADYSLLLEITGKSRIQAIRELRSLGLQVEFSATVKATSKPIFEAIHLA